MILTQSTQDAFFEHVKVEFPHEACGMIIGGQYYACTNSHPSPDSHFRIAEPDGFNLQASYGRAEAILHSHTYSPDRSKRPDNYYDFRWPSVPDQEGYLAGNIPWGITVCDGNACTEINWLEEEVKSLEQRKFAWFTADCYALVRDWYKIHLDVVLPNVTRRWNFWNDGGNCLENGLEAMTFVDKVYNEAPKYGDVLAMSVNSNTVNHLGIYTKENTMFHQFLDKYAIESPWSWWVKKQGKYVLRLNREKYEDYKRQA